MMNLHSNRKRRMTWQTSDKHINILLQTAAGKLRNRRFDSHGNHRSTTNLPIGPICQMNTKYYTL